MIESPAPARRQYRHGQARAQENGAAGKATKPMPKRRQSPQQRGGPQGSPTRFARFASELREADKLIERKRWAEARAMLHDLDRQYPHQPEILERLVNTAHQVNDLRAHLQAIERLARLQPGDPDVRLVLGSSYMLNFFPGLALRTFRQFIERWPQHDGAVRAREDVERLTTLLLEQLGGLGLPDDETLALAAQQEEVQTFLARGEWTQARQHAEQVLRRKPDFVPVLNNLSLALAAEGQLDRAASTAREVLTHDPTNYHALSNLTRFLCQLGQFEEAREPAAKLKRLDTTNPDIAAKQAEALSYLGDDEAVLAVAQRLDATPERDAVPTHSALVSHLAAVALQRLGRTADARRLWERALRLAPWLAVAQANLNDLRQKEGPDHAPWPFEIDYWVPRATLADLAKAFDAGKGRNKEQVQADALRRMLQRHPEIDALIPILLDRGDPVGREFALRIALAVGSPARLAALRDFALGQRGPDTMRTQAAQAAQRAGLLPAGQVRFWSQGEWRDVLILGIEIYDEPVSSGLPKRIEQRQGEAILAIREGDPARAEEILRQALEQVPDDPGLLNNLAAAYSHQGRDKETSALIREIHERFPDYFFGQVNQALLDVREGRLDEAKALLEPLLSRQRLHYSEFTALMNAQVEYYVARGERVTALSWVDFWSQADPDSPAVLNWRQRLSASGLRQRLFGR
jgi:tetratricopeptide (TPR) repeat protein